MDDDVSEPDITEAADTPLASPCIRICCLDDNNVCLGCFRSLEEIRNWQASDNPTRAIVLQESAQRREAHDLRFPGLRPLAPRAS